MQKTWIRILTTGLSIGMMLLIFLFSTEPAEQSDSTSRHISDVAADTVRPGWREMAEPERSVFFNQVQYVVRKCAHFTEFTLLGISLRLCLESWLGGRRSLSAAAWAGGTVYAALDEMHQLLVDGRSGELRDVLLDSTGVLAGVLLTAWLIRRFPACADDQNPL